MKRQFAAPVHLSEETIARADATDLAAYAQSRGYKLSREGSRWRVEGFGGLRINAREPNKWYHHSQDTGGGPVQFLMHMPQA